MTKNCLKYIIYSILLSNSICLLSIGTWIVICKDDKHVSINFYIVGSILIIGVFFHMIYKKCYGDYNPYERTPLNGNVTGINNI